MEEKNFHLRFVHNFWAHIFRFRVLKKDLQRFAVSSMAVKINKIGYHK